MLIVDGIIMMSARAWIEPSWNRRPPGKRATIAVNASTSIASLSSIGCAGLPPRRAAEEASLVTQLSISWTPDHKEGCKEAKWEGLAGSRSGLPPVRMFVSLLFVDATLFIQNGCSYFNAAFCMKGVKNVIDLLRECLLLDKWSDVVAHTFLIIWNDNFRGPTNFVAVYCRCTELANQLQWLLSILLNTFVWKIWAEQYKWECTARSLACSCACVRHP